MVGAVDSARPIEVVQDDGLPAIDEAVATIGTMEFELDVGEMQIVGQCDVGSVGDGVPGKRLSRDAVHLRPSRPGLRVAGLSGDAMARFPAVIRPFRIATPAGVLEKAEIYPVLRKVLAAAEAADDQEVLIVAALKWDGLRYAVEIPPADWDWLREQSSRFGNDQTAVAANSAPSVIEPAGDLRP